MRFTEMIAHFTWKNGAWRSVLEYSNDDSGLPGELVNGQGRRAARRIASPARLDIAGSVQGVPSGQRQADEHCGWRLALAPVSPGKRDVYALPGVEDNQAGKDGLRRRRLGEDLRFAGG